MDYPEGLKEYEIFRGGVSLTTRVGTSLSDSVLIPGTTYEYRVKAIGDNGLESEFSEVFEVITELGDE